eukprot:2889028-Rhodomonas_salina.10
MKFGEGGGAPHHADDPDTRSSVTGYVVMLNGATVSWQSTSQQVTASSTVEAENYAASVAGTNVTYMRRIMEDMGFAQLGPPVLWKDNMACIHHDVGNVGYVCQARTCLGTRSWAGE